MTDTSRRRGGQNKNLNALKNGIYSKQLKDLESKDLRSLVEQGLEQEIAMLRVLMRRTLEISESDPVMKEAVRLLGAVGLAATRLSVLLRGRQALQEGEVKDGKDVISAIIDQANEEIRQQYLEWREE